MAVPARHTSKAKKNKRRTHYKLTAPSVQFDETTGDYSRSHRVSLKGYYKGRLFFFAFEVWRAGTAISLFPPN